MAPGSVKTPPVLVLDVGGTWTRAALVSRQGEVLRSDRMRTDSAASQARYADDLVALVARLSSAGAPDAVAIGVTGPVDVATGTLFQPPNAGGSLTGLPLGPLLARATGLPVAVDRDTNVAALAEHAFGAAVGVDDFVYLTVSTGVGGAVMLDGRLLRGALGVGGELGHVSVDPAGPRCGCGRLGCVEAIASGPALVAAATSAAAGDAAGRLREMLVDGGLTGERVHEAALGRDAAAQKVLDRAGQAVASACVDVVNVFNPRLVVLGGSVARGNPEWVRLADRRVRAEALAPARDVARVVPAALGDDGGLIGGVLLAARSS